MSSELIYVKASQVFVFRINLCQSFASLCLSFNCHGIKIIRISIDYKAPPASQRLLFRRSPFFTTRRGVLVARLFLIGNFYAVVHLQLILNVWCCGRKSENQANQLASLTPVLVVFQKTLELYFLWYDMAGLPIAHCCSFRASQIFFCYREKVIHFLTI